VTIGVFGLGRFGSFWASTLHQHFPNDTILGYSRQSAPPPGVQRVDLFHLCQAETLFLCNSISSMPEVLSQIKPYLSPTTLVVDTCSVKVYPVQVMLQHLGSDRPLLATHPMFGPDSAKQGLKNLPIVVHPLGGDHPLQDDWLRRFQEMGLRVLLMSPEEHDEVAAFTQGLTHLVGRVLKEMNLEQHPMATKGFSNLFEIMNQTCNDPWQLFLDLQRYNRFTPLMREKFLQSLRTVLNAIEEEA